MQRVMLFVLAGVLSAPFAVLTLPGVADATERGTARTDATDATAERVSRRAALISRRVASSLDQARVTRSRIAVHCLDETLSEVNAVVRQVTETRDALPRLDAQERRNRHQVLGTLEGRLTSLELQAIACEGGTSREVSGETVVEVTVGRFTPTHENPGVVPTPPRDRRDRRPFEH